MLSLGQARVILLEGVMPLSTEQEAIGRCGGRVLAADVRATRDQPPNAVSAMDGYAIRRWDAALRAELKVIGEAPAGAPFAGSVKPGEAVRIATGGVLPEGADLVVIQEHVERLDDRIRIVEWGPDDPPPYIRPAGCDFAAGELLARSGEMITPALHALLAAANLASAEVSTRPKVAILPNGDELREPGADLAPGNVVNSASYALADLITMWGGQAVRLPILPDDLAACEEMLRTLDLDADVLITIGGASVGDRDVLRPLLVKLGAEMLFERIAVQPGKPSWHARFPDGRLTLGLPGNPASAFVCAHLLLKPLLYRLLGRDAAQATSTITARLDEPLAANGSRETFLRARCHVGGGGRIRASALPFQDSSLVSTLALANSLIRRPANAAAAAAGELVDVLPVEGFKLASTPVAPAEASFGQ